MNAQFASGSLTPDHYDAVIVGAGAAGLSLACHVANAGWGERVLIVDDGSHPLWDRSWAWWSTGAGLLDTAASTVVDHLRVAGEGWSRGLRLAPYSYRRISGRELSDVADRYVASKPGYRRVAGSVGSIAEDRDRCRVRVRLLGSGDEVQVSARWVFDSVGVGSPSNPTPASAGFLDFHGLYVECPADVFSSSSATLMDFRTDQSAGVAFVYVLPTSARTALVERTVFAFADTYDRDVQSTSHEAHVREYIRAHVRFRDYRVTGREVGTIPLQRGTVAKAQGRVIPIGARAGMVRASTGYGFERIQRHSAEITGTLLRGRNPAKAARTHRWGGALDDVLLRVIREDPATAVEVFTAMLMRNSAPRILAFLDEDAGPLDQLKLILTLPKTPFLRALAQRPTGRRAVLPARLAS